MTLFGIPLHTFVFGFLGSLVGGAVSRRYITPRLLRKTR